jgi:glycosyltransferase involved in cell wall biosynthesis
MNIGMILDGPFPPDPRVENEALTLIARGHNVFLFCLDVGDSAIRSENVSGIEVRRHRMARIWRSLSSLAYSVSWYHSARRPRMRSFLAENESDVEHAHDIQAADVIRELSHELRIPLVLDLHENRPAIMKEYDHVRSFPGRVLIRPERWRAAEERAIEASSRTIVVTEEAKQAYVDRLSIEAKKIVVVPNTVRRAFFSDYDTDDAILAKYSGHFTLLYLGETGLRRGLLTVLTSVRSLVSEIPELKFAIVGKSRFDPTLHNYVRDNPLQDYVEFEGWQDFRTFPSFILASDVGLCPIHRNPHHDTTYANKIFQCLSLGRPMIVSDCPAQMHLVREHRCGLVFEDRNVPDFTSQVHRLYREPDLREQLGESGRRTIREQLNWEQTSTELVELYDTIDSPPPSGQ